MRVHRRQRHGRDVDSTAAIRSEIAWLRALIKDLEEGRLTWDAALIKETLERFQ